MPYRPDIPHKVKSNTRTVVRKYTANILTLPRTAHLSTGNKRNKQYNILHDMRHTFYKHIASSMTILCCGLSLSAMISGSIHVGYL